jgi:hypothetical protein
MMLSYERHKVQRRWIQNAMHDLGMIVCNKNKPQQ